MNRHWFQVQKSDGDVRFFQIFCHSVRVVFPQGISAQSLAVPVAGGVLLAASLVASLAAAENSTLRSGTAKEMAKWWGL